MGRRVSLASGIDSTVDRGRSGVREPEDLPRPALLGPPSPKDRSRTTDLASGACVVAHAAPAAPAPALHDVPRLARAELEAKSCVLGNGRPGLSIAAGGEEGKLEPERAGCRGRLLGLRTRSTLPLSGARDGLPPRTSRQGKRAWELRRDGTEGRGSKGQSPQPLCIL